MGTSSFAGALVAGVSIYFATADETCLLQRTGGEVTDLSGRAGATVETFTFVNQCSHDIDLVDWSMTIPAKSTKQVSGLRPKASTRISWKFTSPANTWNFIELNSNWRGAGDALTGHPSFSSYEGWSTSARYEALKPGSEEPCGADYGAEVRFDARSAQDQKLCKPTADSGSCEASVIASCFQCDPDVGGDGRCPAQEGPQPVCLKGSEGDFCRYLFDNTYALSYNAETGEKTTEHDFQHGPTTDTYVQYWCASIAHLPAVASLVDCLAKGQPFELRVTACVEGDSAPEVLTPPASAVLHAGSV